MPLRQNWRFCYMNNKFRYSYIRFGHSLSNKYNSWTVLDVNHLGKKKCGHCCHLKIQIDDIKRHAISTINGKRTTNIHDDDYIRNPVCIDFFMNGLTKYVSDPQNSCTPYFLWLILLLN